MQGNNLRNPLCRIRNPFGNFTKGCLSNGNQRNNQVTTFAPNEGPCIRRSRIQRRLLFRSGSWLSNRHAVRVLGMDRRPVTTSDRRVSEILADLDEGANYVGGLYNGLPQEVEQRFLKAVVDVRELVTRLTAENERAHDQNIELGGEVASLRQLLNEAMERHNRLTAEKEVFMAQCATLDAENDRLANEIVIMRDMRRDE
jgi:hypothetical protein